MDTRSTLHLSECEREALTKAIWLVPSFSPTRRALVSMLERSTPKRPDVRYVVKCATRRKVWEKVFYNKLAAQEYARHATQTWCRREDVRIQKQRWISY